MRNRSTSSLAVCGAVLLLAPALAAEPLELDGQAGLAKALTGYQARELSIGFGVAAGVNLPMMPELAIDGHLQVIFLGDGDPPRDSRLRDGGSATAYGARIGLQYRPWGSEWGTSALSGLWLSAGGGAVLTGGLIRPLAEGNLGYDLVFAESGFGLGPVVTWSHVFQPDSALRPDDANVLMLGVHMAIRPEGQVVVPLDEDGDGILPPQDQCPSVPEDLDGHDDADGCPDRDNDKDGLDDVQDRCPDNAEDKDGFEDADGCPEVDNDKDGVLDAKDQCPKELEDRDGYQDDDGCPEADNDGDGLLDEKDLCPLEPEVKNGYADEDGCPDSEQVRVVGDKIVLDEKVHFQVNNAAIRRVSHPLLKRVAKLILDNPDYVHIEVQGHADQIGAADFNMKLSTARAESVMQFLISEGIDADRVSFVGFGEDQPISERSDEYSLFMNRRVEFKITRRESGSSAPASALEGLAPPPPAEAAPPKSAPEATPSATPPASAGKDASKASESSAPESSPPESSAPESSAGEGPLDLDAEDHEAAPPPPAAPVPPPPPAAPPASVKESKP